MKVDLLLIDTSRCSDCIIDQTELKFEYDV